MKNYDALALGELLIDFTTHGTSAQGHPLLEANPGGAPGNVMAMLARLGRRTALISKVGVDAFGRQLKNALLSAGVENRFVCSSPDTPTTLAFVQTSPDGDRDFTFYRNPGADVTLTAQDLPHEALRSCRLFHFGSLSMTHSTCREATLAAIDEAHAAGAICSFDPNLRPPLWSSLDIARQMIACGLERCDVLKMAEEEITWFTGRESSLDAAKDMQQRYALPLVFVTQGARGSFALSEDVHVAVPGFPVHALDTTGAGDTFFGCVLHQVLTLGLRHYTAPTLCAMLRLANAAAALITTRQGALTVMPTPQEIEQQMKG